MSPLCIVVLSSRGTRVLHSETPRLDRYEERYRPELWALARAYTVTGPAGHPWGHWLGALLMLAAVALVLGAAL